MNKLFGMTITNPWELDLIVSTLKSLPTRIYVRLVFDPGQSASKYIEIVDAIFPLADILACPIDSSSAKQYSVNQYKARFQEFVSAFSSKVSVWEIGNEINGDWLGDSISEKVEAAFDVVKAAGGNTGVTLYLDPSGRIGIDSLSLIPYHIGVNLDWVLVSYYYEDNSDYEPKFLAVNAELKTLYPNSDILIGECGDKRSEAKAREVFDKFYNDLAPEWQAFSLFGGFWWYQEQLIGPNAFLLPAFKEAI